MKRWKEKEKLAIERARKFILSIYDKGSLFGSTDEKPNEYNEYLGQIQLKDLWKKTAKFKKQNSNAGHTKFVGMHNTVYTYPENLKNAA